jgi:Trypsin-like peptidase domain
MKTKIKSLIAFVMLSAASLTLLFALPHAQPNTNPQAAPPVTVPSIVSTRNDNGGMHTRADTVLPSIRYGSHLDLNQASVTLDWLDIHSVTMTAPNQIGVNRSLAVSPETRAQKVVNPDGSQIIVLIIKSSGASGIGVHFRNFALADDDEVYVYGPAPDSIVFGPFRDKGPWGSGEFWSGTLAGDTAIIEFYTRTGENGKAFEIFEISHIFPELDLRLRSDQPDVLPCELDASCYPNSLNNAVGRILFNDNGHQAVCTGILLNDLAQDQIPYFLTANHCVSTQAVAQTVEVFWFYQTTSCNSGMLRSDWVQQVGGANLLATQSSNDFSLLRLVNNAPAGAWFSGWTSDIQSTGTAVFGLHHPDGFTPPAIDSYLREAHGIITSTNAACLGLVNGYRTDWTSGTTEPGSSGSGLWNSSGYLVGVLSCGPSPPTCSSPDSAYSKFANFYSQIQPYIGHPPFFNGETALGGGFYYLQFANGTPFGYYSYLPNQNFIYHIDLGFEYLFDANDANNGIYFYDFASSSFFYTSPSTFPDLYDFSLNAWLYYLPDVANPGHYTHNPRWFYNFATGQWITL